MVEHGLESPWAERLKEWKPDPKHDARITTRVPCADYFGVRDQALMAHATQIDPDGPFFHIPLDIQRAVWPTEDFELVESHVESPLPEDDLFAGITGHTGRGVLSGTCDNGVMNPHVVLTFVLPLVDKVPKDNDVKAGWTAFAVFVALAIAVALLGVSLVRHLRKARGQQGRRHVR